MTSYIDDQFSTPEQRTPQNISDRRRISTRRITRQFSDATNQFSGVGLKKNKYQQNYSGANINTVLSTEMQNNKDPLSYQNKIYMDDTHRFLATGERKRRDNGKPREFELSSDTVSRLNVFPDGKPRTGVVADLMKEEAAGSTLGQALTDFKTMLQNGIPIKVPGMSDADFKTMLEQQYKTKGAQMIFSESEHAKAAEKEAADRRKELLDMIKAGNVDRLRMIEDIRILQQLGEITNDQFDTLIEMTSNLSDGNVKKEAERILTESKKKASAKLAKAEFDRENRIIDSLAQKLDPIFEQIKDGTLNSYNNTEMEIKGDTINFRDALFIDEFSSGNWIEVFLEESDNTNSIKFDDPKYLADTMKNIEMNPWARGMAGKSANRERLALYGILNLYSDKKRNPTFKEIETIRNISNQVKSSFNASDRMKTLNDFLREVDKKLNPIVLTPPKPKRKSSA